MLFQPGAPLILTFVPAAFRTGRSLVYKLEPVTGTADLLLTVGRLPERQDSSGHSYMSSGLDIPVLGRRWRGAATEGN